jgi:Mrp family chromosome partitioning ATPase/capsular polysaccharide biosynthesis protein
MARGGLASGGEVGDGMLRYVPPEVVSDEPVEVGRYADALKRSRLLIVLIVVPLTLLVYFLSTQLPKTYRATSKIVLQATSDPFSSDDAASDERRLATIRTLLTTRANLRQASSRLRGESATSLKDKVQSSVDPTANIVNVTASDETARGAASIANAVATSFLAKERSIDRQRVRRARASLVRALQAMEGRRGEQAAIERTAIREQLRELNVGAATSGSELALAEAAQPPADPYAPQPLRNAVFGLFAAAFLAALVVVARAHLHPRIGGARELSRLLGIPILAEIPFVRRGLGGRTNTLSTAEYEAYQTLVAALRMQLPPQRQQIVLVTSALHGEGKSEVTAALGLVLSQMGKRTWLVSADMRRPKLHELFDVAQAPGLAEVLASRRHEAEGGGDGDGAAAVSASRGPSLAAPGDGSLHVLASGRTPADPAQLLVSSALEAFLEEIRESDYDYVLLDGPPLLGLVDSQVLSQRVDGVLIVGRPPHLSPKNAVDLEQLLARLRVEPLGLVIVDES